MKVEELWPVVIDGETWFFTADECKMLEYSNPTITLDRLELDEMDKFKLGLPDGETICVNEYGFYSHMLGSKKPNAKAIKRWVAHEVLPAIRKYGVYATPENIEAMLADPEIIIGTLKALKAERKAQEAGQHKFG